MLERLPTANARLEWISRARADLKTFPEEVRFVFGYALLLAELGGKHPDAKPLTGDPAFRGSGVLEVVDDHDGNTYRAVYTVRFAGVVYVLHAFQKKSKKGVQTSKNDIDVIKRRLKTAREHYEQKYAKREAS
jgi:phage-related protein